MTRTSDRMSLGARSGVPGHLPDRQGGRLGPVALVIVLCLGLALACQPGAAAPTVVRGYGNDQTQGYRLRQGAVRFTVNYTGSGQPNDLIGVTLVSETKGSAKVLVGTPTASKPVNETLTVNIPETGDYSLHVLANGPWVITIQQ